MAVPLSLHLLDSVISLASAALFLSVGRLVSHRDVSPDATPASRAFGAWWYGLGGLSLVGVLGTFLTAFDLWTLPLMLAWLHILLPMILAALACLLYYLVFVYTGRRGAWKPLAVLYLALWAMFVYVVAAAEPVGICPPASTECESNPLSTTIVYRNSLAGSPTATALGVALVLPVLGAAVAYFTLFFRTKDPTARYRIALTSLSIALWFGFSLVSSLTTEAASRDIVATLISRAVAMAAAFGVFFAFRPPAWARRKWAIEPVRSAGKGPSAPVPPDQRS